MAKESNLPYIRKDGIKFRILRGYPGGIIFANAWQPRYHHMYLYFFFHMYLYKKEAEGVWNKPIQRRSHVKTAAEIRVMWPQTKDAWTYQKLREASWNTRFPVAGLREFRGIFKTWFSTAWLPPPVSAGGGLLWSVHFCVILKICTTKWKCFGAVKNEVCPHSCIPSAGRNHSKQFSYTLDCPVPCSVSDTVCVQCVC